MTYARARIGSGPLSTISQPVRRVCRVGRVGERDVGVGAAVGVVDLAVGRVDDVVARARVEGVGGVDRRGVASPRAERPALQRVVAVELVVARPAREAVAGGARAAVHLIVAGAAVEEVGPDAAVDPVVPVATAYGVDGAVGGVAAVDEDVVATATVDHIAAA